MGLHDDEEPRVLFEFTINEQEQQIVPDVIVDAPVEEPVEEDDEIEEPEQVFQPATEV